MDSEVFRGGVNQVVRVGAVVLRPTGPWTPAVHALLRHVAAAGFSGAPRVHGVDDQGREILDFVAGAVATDPVPAYARRDAALAAAGRLAAATLPRRDRGVRSAARRGVAVAGTRSPRGDLPR
ncbi:hypothetical protein [Thermobifida fusca]|uniref:hypothetical protein n=1 Tax=Thermobifida fusca TaxID=2021 RepID=UPI000303A1E1|nr:hypothetical protein [Thermobifida fusca]